MTEAEWLTRCGFHWLGDRPLYTRATARQVVLLAAAWLRRFDRYWSPLPSPSEVTAAIFRNDQMRRAIDFLERWADGASRPLELGEAAKNAREEAQFARVLYEDLVEDNDERLMEWRAYVTESAADAAEFVCDLIRVCDDPGRTLADALAVLGDRSRPNLPSIVLGREGRGLRLGTPQQRYLDCLTNDLCGLSGAVAEASGLASEGYNDVVAAEGRAEQLLMHDIFGNPFRPATFLPEWRTTTVLNLAQQMYDSRDFSPVPILADALQDAGCDNADILNHCRGPGSHVRGCWVVDLVLGKG